MKCQSEDKRVFSQWLNVINSGSKGELTDGVNMDIENDVNSRTEMNTINLAQWHDAQDELNKNNSGEMDESKDKKSLKLG